MIPISTSRLTTADPVRNAGTAGRAGHAGMGHASYPTKLVKQGVRACAAVGCPHERHQLRRLHPACRAGIFIGGPLALVRNGDRITLDVAARTINLDVPEAELAKRRAAWKPPETRFERGYGWMFTRHIKQANEGCDFDFLETGFGKPVDEPSIY